MIELNGAFPGAAQFADSSLAAVWHSRGGINVERVVVIDGKQRGIDDAVSLDMTLQLNAFTTKIRAASRDQEFHMRRVDEI